MNKSDLVRYPIFAGALSVFIIALPFFAIAYKTVPRFRRFIDQIYDEDPLN